MSPVAFPRFYPVVPDVSWVARLVPLGVEVIQLRLKDAAAKDVGPQILEAKKICASTGCQLVVNDYWREAIALECGFIHLGQEDLAAADLPAIKKAGLKLGLSTHDEAELEIALVAEPDYVALGPVYETTLKKMKWAPQGLDKVSRWAQKSAPIPLVAIGGITQERAAGVLGAGAASVAVVTDIIKQKRPEIRVSAWLDALGTNMGGG